MRQFFGAEINGVTVRHKEGFRGQFDGLAEHEIFGSSALFRGVISMAACRYALRGVASASPPRPDRLPSFFACGFLDDRRRRFGQASPTSGD